MRLLLLLLLLSPTRRHRNSSSHPTDFINFHPHFRPLFCCPFDIFHILISERKIKDNRGKLQRRIPWVRCFLLFFFCFWLNVCHASSNRSVGQQREWWKNIYFDLKPCDRPTAFRLCPCTLCRCPTLLLWTWCETWTLNPVGDAEQGYTTHKAQWIDKFYCVGNVKILRRSPSPSSRASH